MGNPLGLRGPATAVDTVLALMGRQCSLITRRQWVARGLTERQLDHAIKTKAVSVVHPGVYRLRGAARSFEQDVLAACLATGGVASHRCAAFLWKLRKFERPVVEVLVASGHTPRLAGIKVRRTGRLDPSERTQIGSIPTTTVARTLLDLVSTSPDCVEGALDGALHRRKVTLRALEHVLERAGRRHRGSLALAPLVASRRAGRAPTESELEDDLLALIRRFGLPEPVPQFLYKGRRIDFAYPELEFGLEAHGVVAHSAKEDVQRNAEKANDLLEWWILYFTYDDIHGTPAAVAHRIADAMRRRQARPPALPAA